jgi:hypothetical protein
MNTKYYDLINQTFYFPQEEFTLKSVVDKSLELAELVLKDC